MKFKNLLLLISGLMASCQPAYAQVTPRPIAASSIYNGAGILYIPTSTPFGNRVPYFDNNSTLASSAVTSTELSYLSGVTSNLQTQINAVTSGAVLSVFGRTGAVTSQSGDYSAFYPLRGNNLSDLTSPSTARTNLGLGTAATQNVGAFDAAGAAATAQAAAQAASDPLGTAAAVQASSLQKTSNLSDLASASTARTNLGLGTAATHANAFFAQTANNLSDLTSAPTARTNLGLGTAATQPSSAFDANGAAATAQAAAQAASDPLGTAATVQAASLQKANNLSDLTSASIARSNLGLGSSATQASSAFDASGAAAAVQAASLQKSNNLSDLSNVATARTNLGLGSAATQPISAFDASGAAATAQAAAQAASDPSGTAATVQAASLQKASNLSDLTSASNARSNLGLGSAAVQPTSAFQAPLTFSSSLLNTANTVTLVNDASNPGASQLYGTDAFGLKGWYPVPVNSGGTVTSIGLSTPAWLTVTGSPVTTSGTISVTSTSQSAHFALMAPSGAAGVMTPRAIVASDIPTLNQNTTGNAATATAFATLPTGCGGGQFANNIDASGNLACATPAGGSGGTAINVSAKSANYTILSSDSGAFDFDTTGASRVATLPSAAAFLVAGKSEILTITKSDTSANSLTISPVGGDLIAGIASVVLTGSWKSITIYSTGSGWAMR